MIQPHMFLFICYYSIRALFALFLTIVIVILYSMNIFVVEHFADFSLLH